jgi:DNA-binding transcriptional LysR family regulator
MRQRTRQALGQSRRYGNRRNRRRPITCPAGKTVVCDRRTPQALTAHDSINLRLPPQGDLYAREFEKDGRELRVRVEGQLVFNTVGLVLNAAVAGFGLAYLPEQQVRKHLDNAELVRVLANWRPPLSRYHLYNPSRRQPTQAVTLLVDALRYHVSARPGRK